MCIVSGMERTDAATTDGLSAGTHLRLAGWTRPRCPSSLKGVMVMN
jgi:hypothetical protein